MNRATMPRVRVVYRYALAWLFAMTWVLVFVLMLVLAVAGWR